jgi:hypothetical protein
LTRSLLIERQFGAPLVGWGWLRYGQLPALSRCLLRRSGRIPLNLLLAEFLGCIVGPWAYFSSRRHLRKRTGIL